MVSFIVYLLQQFDKFEQVINFILLSPKLMFTPNQLNAGGRFLINTTVDKYWDTLHKVKSTFKLPDKTKTTRIKPLVQNKKQVFETHQHLRNLMSLHTRIQDIGSWQDRLKNPCDPIAHPALFFRKVRRSISKSSNKRMSQDRPKTSFSQKSSLITKQCKNKSRSKNKQLKISPVVSLQKLNDLLPTLTSFSKQDIRKYTQGLVAAVQYFDIKNREQLQQLQQAAMKCVPENYPNDFESILKVTISEIGKYL